MASGQCPSGQYLTLCPAFILSLLHPTDGAPDIATSVSVSEPAMRRTPVYVDGQTHTAILIIAELTYWIKNMTRREHWACRVSTGVKISLM